MLIDKKIERYVRDAARYVPAGEKGRMSRELTDMIYEVVGDYAAGEEPDILDVKDVLRDLGTPEEVAANYMESKRNRVEEHGHHAKELLRDWPKLFYSALSVIGTVLVIVGMIGIGTQKIDTMLPVFIGVVFALISITGRGVMTAVLHIRPDHRHWDE